MLTIFYVVYLIFFSGLFVYCMKYKHLLLMLLSLEYMVIGVFLFISIMLYYYNHYMCLIYLVFSTCEGALGLSLLVSMSRTYGSDYYLMMNFD